MKNKKAKAKTISVNLWDHYDRVSLAAQRIALIEKSLNFKDQKNESEAFNFIMELGDDGSFKLNPNDLGYVSSGRIRVNFEREDSTKKVIPEILFELT